MVTNLMITSRQYGATHMLNRLIDLGFVTATATMQAHSDVMQEMAMEAISEDDKYEIAEEVAKQRDNPIK